MEQLIPKVVITMEDLEQLLLIQGMEEAMLVVLHTLVDLVFSS
jgi:hypothetical protein